MGRNHYSSFLSIEGMAGWWENGEKGRAMAEFSKPKKRWRKWRYLMVMLVMLLIAWIGNEFWFQWQQNQADQEALLLDPYWHTDLVAEYLKQDVDPLYVKLWERLPKVWKGMTFDDWWNTKPELTRYHGYANPNVELPTDWMKLFTETMQDKELSGVRGLLSELCQTEPKGRFKFEPDTPEGKLLSRYLAFLTDEIEWKTSQGKVEDALSMIEHRLKLLRHIAKSPWLKTHALATAFASQAGRDLERVLAQRELSDQKLLGISERWINYDPEQLIVLLRKEMRLEAEDYLNGNKKGWYSKPSLTSFEAIRPLEKQLIYSWDRVRLPSMRLHHLQHMNQAQQRWRECKDIAEVRCVMIYMDSRDFFADNTRAYFHGVREFVLMDILPRIAIACERYRLKNQRWPQELLELGPSFLTVVPKDPVTGRDFQLLKRTDGITIYSWGYNFKDDQGNHFSDQVFRLYDVPSRKIPFDPTKHIFRLESIPK